LQLLSCLCTRSLVKQRGEKSGGGGKRDYTLAGKCTTVKVCWQMNFQLVSGLYKNFTGMSPSEFDYLNYLIGGKI
jgi:hypothetical protein